ncbi:GNAT family N-acetyltransferase [Rhizobium sp. L1K21]|uniref:GNAT family N-acetyltransferase n=1 Tax=Rhizobium sp. L1K21 TaxID=2954933 RepID=UPI0020939919|nr:GNAT family N-acetyltransferase [Rhizobium sp. L1K21]MCO6184937.1 GNAT family N-acetyltransferase [Rhizobium sp. L1K21]
MPQPILETERLILRLPQADDLDGWSRLMADEAASLFIGGPMDRTGAWANLCLMRGAWDIEGFSNFSVIEKATGRWIGRAGPWSPPGWPGREIGWAFLREVWGRGFAKEAAQASMAWAWQSLGWREAVHIIHPDNLRSIALAKAIGSEFKMSLEAGRLGSKTPLQVFGQTLHGAVMEDRNCVSVRF